jgi:hypothetical protein
MATTPRPSASIWRAGGVCARALAEASAPRARATSTNRINRVAMRESLSLLWTRSNTAGPRLQVGPVGPVRPRRLHRLVIACARASHHQEGGFGKRREAGVEAACTVDGSWKSRNNARSRPAASHSPLGSARRGGEVADGTVHRSVRPSPIASDFPLPARDRLGYSSVL